MFSIYSLQYYFFCGSFLASSSFGSGGGVGSLKVSGLSMRPSPTESHGVDVSKFRKAEISDEVTELDTLS